MQTYTCIRCTTCATQCRHNSLQLETSGEPKSGKNPPTLTTAGAASNTQSDIVQGCFKTLTLLISHQKFSSPPKASMPAFDDTKSSIDSTHRDTLPLSSDQMQALLSLLHSAVFNKRCLSKRTRYLAKENSPTVCEYEFSLKL